MRAGPFRIELGQPVLSTSLSPHSVAYLHACCWPLRGWQGPDGGSDPGQGGILTALLAAKAHTGLGAQAADLSNPNIPFVRH